MSDRGNNTEQLAAILDALEAEDDYVRSWKLARQIRAALAAHDAVVADRARREGRTEALQEAADAWPGLRTEGNVYVWLTRLADREATTPQPQEER